MKLWRYLVFAASGFVVSCSAAPAHKSEYLALGDSYTIGESVDAAQRWPVKLAAQLKKQGIDVGEARIIATTGWTVSELSAGMDRENLRGPYRLVTLLIGVNDQYRGRGSEEFRPEFAAMLKRAIGLAGNKAGRVIVVSIPDWGVTPFARGQDQDKIGREIDAFNSVCKEEASKAQARFVDVTTISREARNDATLIAGDGLHPSGKMYGRWVEKIAPVALDALKE